MCLDRAVHTHLQGKPFLFAQLIVVDLDDVHEDILDVSDEVLFQGADEFGQVLLHQLFGLRGVVPVHLEIEHAEAANKDLNKRLLVTEYTLLVGMTAFLSHDEVVDSADVVLGVDGAVEELLQVSVEGVVIVIAEEFLLLVD